MLWIGLEEEYREEEKEFSPVFFYGVYMREFFIEKRTLRKLDV